MPKSQSIPFANSQQPKTIAYAMLNRRISLHLNQLQASEAAGMGINAFSQYEQGRNRAITPAMATRIELFVRWEPGSIMNLIANNEEPVNLDEGDAEVAIPEPSPSMFEKIESLQRQVTALETKLSMIGKALS